MMYSDAVRYATVCWAGGAITGMSGVYWDDG